MCRRLEDAHKHIARILRESETQLLPLGSGPEGRQEDEDRAHRREREREETRTFPLDASYLQPQSPILHEQRRGRTVQNRQVIFLLKKIKRTQVSMICFQAIGRFRCKQPQRLHAFSDAAIGQDKQTALLRLFRHVHLAGILAERLATGEQVPRRIELFVRHKSVQRRVQVRFSTDVEHQEQKPPPGGQVLLHNAQRVPQQEGADGTGAKLRRNRGEESEVHHADRSDQHQFAVQLRHFDARERPASGRGLVEEQEG